MASPPCAADLLLPAGVSGGGARRRVPLDHERPFWGREEVRRSRRFLSFETPPQCSKMYVPGIGEGSPEKKASRNLPHFFNYIAVRVVLTQLEHMAS